MTGPEHYKEAERLVAEADAVVDRVAEHFPYMSEESLIAARASLLAAAQVHASLAQAAAYVGGPYGKWRDVIEGPKQ